ncbi:NFACT RNA binding domain-containing protein [Shivajiella indica]|uniref:NFACT RNA binding domain-containing protein n=1 Tax=Shivajiella indica TaxID=872115 RepID=A0ABW5BBB8_9BACT
MHLNYHFLKYLCPELSLKFTGMRIITCFSQNKDELVIGCANHTGQCYIRANLLPIISCLSFPEEFKRSKKNTVSLFPELIGQIITEIKVFSFERAFKINFDSGDSLVFKLHGTRSNVLYYPKDYQLPASIFRNELKEDKNLQLADIEKHLDLSFDNFQLMEGNASQFLPTLGKIPREWLKSKGYIEADLQTKWRLIQEVLDLLDSPHYAIIKENNEFLLSLLPVQKAVFDTSDPVEASNELFRYKVVIQAFEKEKNQWIRIFEEQKKKTKAYILKTSQKLEELEKEVPPSQVADVLMANLHQIPPGSEAVLLFNFYTQKEEPFKLKKGQTPQKFAETLYRKSKNRKKEIDQLHHNLDEKDKMLSQTMDWIEDLNGIKDFKSLKEFIKSKHLSARQKEKEEQVPYKRFEIEGFEILVGKSAKANDELLRYFAWKDDLWLHAKDVSGSHVVIKYRSGINFPKTVIERAAELAAYYSKNINESLAPVIYTPAKFVRKVKGSPSGAVMVDKESVLMVVPRGPQEN